MRLTRHFENRESVEMYDIRDICKEFDKNFKLSQLEDIEDELGIDIITLFKALKNGIWVKEENNLISHYIGYISNRSYGFICIEQEYISYYEVFLENMRKEMNFNLKDYGKTWALTKEELEDGKKI